MSFNTIFKESKIILTEGALVERLKSEFNFEMDASIIHAGLIYSHPEILKLLYGQYIGIAKTYDLPIMIMTPTRKVNAESIQKSSYRGRDILHDACIFLKRIRESYKEYSGKIMIGGLLGNKGDAYSGAKIFSPAEAYKFHKQQTIQFQEQNIDFLFAGIIPEINEAIGLAKAMAETNLPYMISFMIRKDGHLMDGTLLSDAIKIIDEQVFSKPMCYVTNCIHPTNLIEALNQDGNKSSIHLKRFYGIQANASVLSPEELNNCSSLKQDDFTNIIEEMCFLQKHFDFKIFGGCCGTNHEFLDSLSKKLINTQHSLG